MKLKTLALSLAVAGATAVSMVPVAAQAEVSYNAAVSNMYLWRGQNLSTSGGVVSGGVDYATESGFGVGMWASSEGAIDADGSSEFDLYATYGTSFDAVDFSLGYFKYFYPNTTGPQGTASEYMVGLGFGGFSASAMINTDDTDSRYYSLDYSVGDLGFHYGITDSSADGDDYTDYNVSYAATDSLSFTLSKADGDFITDATDNPMIAVSYSLPL